MKSLLFSRLVFDNIAVVLSKLWFSHRSWILKQIQRKCSIYRSHTSCVRHCLGRWVIAEIYTNYILSNRFFQVCLGVKSSRWRKLNNGLPQRSVLAPILFNLYVFDVPSTLSKQFHYADDIALTFKADSFSD
jgi:hypothetical protein